MSVSWGERGIEREWDGERANQKKSCSRQSADRARITCRGCDDKESEQRERERKVVGGGQLIGTPSHSEIVMLWPLMAST